MNDVAFCGPFKSPLGFGFLRRSISCMAQASFSTISVSPSPCSRNPSLVKEGAGKRNIDGVGFTSLFLGGTIPPPF